MPMHRRIRRTILAPQSRFYTLTKLYTGLNTLWLCMPRNGGKVLAGERQGRITSRAILIQRRGLCLVGYIYKNTSPGFYSLTFYRKPKALLTIGRLINTALREFDNFFIVTLINQVSISLITNSIAFNCL
jgi:hypothetical protein